MMKPLIGLAVLSTCALAACSTTPPPSKTPSGPSKPTGPTPQEQVAARADAFIQGYQNTATGSPTTSTTMPTSGNATYSGIALMQLEHAGAPATAPHDVFMGTAEIAAEFTGAGVSLDGTASDFIVRRFDNRADMDAASLPVATASTPDEQRAALEAMTDTSSLVNGSLTLSASNQTDPAAIPVAVSGDLTHDGTTTRIGGVVGGSLADGLTPNDALRIEGSTAGTMTASQDGATISWGSLMIGARR